MKKYRMCGGLAMTPDRDMSMLKKMSKNGWHLSGMKGILYCFENGQPHDYEYSLNLEKSINSEMLSIYEASGWIPIIATNGYQIFRAEDGTSPIFSDSDSEIEILNDNRVSSGKWALLFAALSTICFILNSINTSIALVVAGTILVVCFVFTFFPFIGYSLSLHKKRKK